MAKDQTNDSRPTITYGELLFLSITNSVTACLSVEVMPINRPSWSEIP